MIADIERVRRFVVDNGLACPPLARLADVASESGEVAKELLMSTGYGARPYQHPPDAALCSEYGDLVFSVLALGLELGCDAAAELDRAIDRYEARIGHGGDPGSVNA